MRRFVSLCIAGLLAGALAGCATRITYQYDAATPAIKASSGTALNVAVLDRRIAIVNKQKPANFVGVTRTSFDDLVGTPKDASGNLFDVTTASGKPLADDFAKTIATALSAKGVRVSLISLPADADEAGAIRRLSEAGGKSLLLVLNEWRTDAQLSTYLICDLHAIVLAPGGAILARSRLHGAENLGGNARNPVAHARTEVPIAYGKKLQELFASPEISAQM